MIQIVPPLVERSSRETADECQTTLDWCRVGPEIMPPWHVQENKWRSARYGLDAVIILDEDSNERLVTDDLDDLLTRLQPIARLLECEKELAAVEEIYRHGGSYQRQRRVAEEHDGDLGAVVDSVVNELEPVR